MLATLVFAAACAGGDAAQPTDPSAASDAALATSSSAPIKQINVKPGTPTLDPSETKKFRAQAKYTDGTQGPITVTWAATGGEITSKGVYTAGKSGGTFQVIGTHAESGMADTAKVTITGGSTPPPSDSTPPPPPPASGDFAGIPFGPYHLPDDGYNSVYTSALRLAAPGNVMEILEAARKARARVIIRMAGGRDNYQNGPDGTFSLDKWKQQLEGYKGMNLQPYIDDGTLMGHYLFDEAANKKWGGATVPFADIEAAAQYSKQLWPTLTTFLRADPGFLKGYSKPWTYLDASWAQYSHRKGPVEQYRSEMVADAKAARLGLVLGINILNGGDGSSKFHGDSPDDWAMSAAEVRTYGKVLAGDPYACGFYIWKWDEAYFNRSDVSSALAEVSGVATNRAATSCRVR